MSENSILKYRMQVQFLLGNKQRPCMRAVGQVSFVGRNETQPGLHFVPMKLRDLQQGFSIPAFGFPDDVDAFVQCFTIDHEDGFVKASG